MGVPLLSGCCLSIRLHQGQQGRSCGSWRLPLIPLPPAWAWVLPVGVRSAIVEAVGMGGRWVREPGRWYRAQQVAAGVSPLLSGCCLSIRLHQGQQGRFLGLWRLLPDSPASSMGAGAISNCCISNSGMSISLRMS